MNKNIGTIDRILRIFLAGVLLYLGFWVYGGSLLGSVLAIMSIVPLITAWLGNCPLYSLLGITTIKTNSNLH